MTRDEAVNDSLIATQYLRPGENVTAAFHRALRERGWAVVPVEPTRAMTGAGDDDAMHDHYARLYRAMLEAVR